MKLGIFAKTFSGDNPEQIFRSVREAGYDAVQYNMACSGIGSLPEGIAAADAQAVATAAKRVGIEIAAVSATYNMIDPDLARREAGRRSFAAIAANAHAMGTRLLTVCTGSCDADDQWRYHPSNESIEAWQDMFREFRELLEIADEFDVDIGVEPELANVVSSAHRARDLIDTLRSDRIKIVFDPANLFEVATPDRRRTMIEEGIRLLEDRIVLAHAKDRLSDGTFAPAGQGVLEFAHFLETLDATGFNGAVITHGLTSTEAPTVAALLRRKLRASEAAA